MFNRTDIDSIFLTATTEVLPEPKGLLPVALGLEQAPIALRVLRVQQRVLLEEVRARMRRLAFDAARLRRMEHADVTAEGHFAALLQPPAEVRVLAEVRAIERQVEASDRLEVGRSD